MIIIILFIFFNCATNIKCRAYIEDLRVVSREVANIMRNIGIYSNERSHGNLINKIYSEFVYAGRSHRFAASQLRGLTSRGAQRVTSYKKATRSRA